MAPPWLRKATKEVTNFAESAAHKTTRETERIVKQGENLVHGNETKDKLHAERDRANAAEARANQAEAALASAASQEKIDPWELGTLPSFEELIAARERVIAAQQGLDSLERRLDLIDVFLSHNGANKLVLMWLFLMLRVCGVRTFFDLRDVQQGIDDDLKSGLARSEVLLAWLSPSFFSTAYPSKETWTFACAFGLNRVLLYAADGMEIPQLKQAGPVVDASLTVAFPGSDPIIADPPQGGMPLGHVLSKHKVEPVFKDVEVFDGGHFRTILLDIRQALPVTSRGHIAIPTPSEARQLGMLVRGNIDTLIEEHGNVYQITREELDQTIGDVQGVMSFASPAESAAPSPEENAVNHDNNNAE
jgi:TIR domain